MVVVGNTLNLNLSTLAKHFSDEGEAYKLMEDIRWPDGPVCPHCGEDERCYFLQPRNGVRRTRTGAVSHRRLWKCGACRKQFSVLVGTIFEDSKVALSKWMMAVFLMASSKNGVAAYELHRTIGVTHKTAWFMCHRIREAMKQEPVAEMFTGTVVADESWIGGSPKNRHRQGVMRKPSGAGSKRAMWTDKTTVFALVNKDTGEVRTRVVPDVTGATLGKALAEQVNVPATHLQTDAHMSYRVLGRQFASHQWVDHSSAEYVRGNVSTNQAENYFSQLKRSIDGTHHHVSRTHLPRYLAEFDFRYSTRKLSDTQRTMMTIRKAEGRRLTYRSVAV